jgi:predicted acetyltransferase
MKKFKTQFIKSKDMNDFVRNNKSLFNKAALYSGNRDYMIAIADDNIVGFACLFNQEVSVNMPLKNAVTLTNIVVDDNYTRNGIATQMLREIAIKLSMNDKVLRRTNPTASGEKYTFDKFSKILKENNLNYITENTSYLFKILDDNVFSSGCYSRNEKFNILNKTISFVLNEKGVKHDANQKCLNLFFKDEISAFDAIKLEKKTPQLLEFLSLEKKKIKKTL